MTEHIVHIDDIEELIISKYFIEQELIKQKLLDNKLSLQEFIYEFLKMNNNIAVYNIFGQSEIIPFYIYKLNDDLYVFFSSHSETTDKFYKYLKSINFDMSNLKPYNGGPNMIKTNYVEYELP